MAIQVIVQRTASDCFGGQSDQGKLINIFFAILHENTFLIFLNSFLS